MRRMSRNGLEFTAAWEDFRPSAYFATEAEKQKGIYTIGFGHTSRVKPEGDITREQAFELLARDVAKAEIFADNNVSPALTQAQFDAIVDLCINVGTGVIAKDGTLGDFDDAARHADVNAMRRILPTFKYQGGTELKGLRRRAAGRLALFDGASAKEAERIGRETP